MYGKHFQSMYTGSLIGKGSAVFAVWGYAISNAHYKTETVELNPKLLAFVIGDDENKMTAAIEVLCEPDGDSRSKELDGKRLVKLGQFLYRVINLRKYREIADEQERRDYKAEWIRNKRRQQRRQVSTVRRQAETVSTQAEGEAEGEAGTSTKVDVAPVDFVSSLKTDPTYSGIDIQREFGKMSKWCEVNGREPTKRRFINWLNRIEKPLKKADQKSEYVYKPPHVGPSRDLTDEQIAKNKEVINKQMKELRDKLRMPA